MQPGEKIIFYLNINLFFVLFIFLVPSRKRLAVFNPPPPHTKNIFGSEGGGELAERGINNTNMFDKIRLTNLIAFFKNK